MGELNQIDVKDRKILYHLYNDSRQSYSQIGKKIGLHKDSVAKRVKNLQERKIILEFVTKFDYLKLGLIPLRFYFNFQYTSKDIKNEIINHFVNCKYTAVVLETEGSHDFIVLILVDNIHKIRPFWQETMDKYRDYFSDMVYSNYWGETLYPASFLLDKEHDGEYIKQKIWKKGLEYDNLDYEILKLLTKNSRTKTIDIAQKLNTNSKTISKRIKRLINNEIILRFSAVINWEKIGYQIYKIDIYLREYRKKHGIIDFVVKNPHLAYIDHTLGYADLELEMYLRGITHLRDFMEDISEKFPQAIRRYSYLTLIKVYKMFVLQ